MLEGGTTLLFVSHSIEQVKKLCDRAVWLDRGIVKRNGAAYEICDKYLLQQ